jgi:ATP-dependent RNA/DNA helicase IGHMBP2
VWWHCSYIDTAGCGLEETSGTDAEGERLSISNPGECDLVCEHVAKLVAAGVEQRDIGVITPYNGQVDLIRSKLADDFANVEVRTVDGFQGREKEAVVISMVRCNVRRTVGFLAEKRRMNVAITRARRHLAVVCDSVTVSNDPYAIL